MLANEADQVPNQDPGDIVFNLVQAKHSVFRRAGSDLSADLVVTLAEALCGFSRVVIKHLDGRGLHMTYPLSKGRILRPGQIIKVAGEGMFVKRSELKGDLYMTVHVKFPDDGYFKDDATVRNLQSLLPAPANPVTADVIDEVDFDVAANLDGYGAGSQDGDDWEDEEEADIEPQCAQQ